MKAYKVLTIVIFMVCAAVFTLVSQGGEWAEEVSATDAEEIPWVTKTSGQKDLSERQVAASEINEMEVKPRLEFFGPFMASKEENIGHHQAIGFDEIPEPVDPRLAQIIEATPLDEATAQIVLDYTDRYDLRLAMVLGLMDLESNFNQYLVGTSQDRGFMQIIPGTEKWLAEDFGEELGLTYDTTRIFDADYNIPLGIKYLSLLKKQYGNETQMLTSYNRGDYGMKKWFNANGTYETAYSRVVLKRAEKYTHIK